VPSSPDRSRKPTESWSSREPRQANPALSRSPRRRWRTSNHIVSKRQDEFRAQFGPDYRCDEDLIFANPDGSPLKRDSISATVSALFKRLKIPKPKGGSLHLLRHTMASQMLDGGVPLTVVSQRLGHSSGRVTADVYSHAIHGQDDEAVRRWEECQQRNRLTKPKNWKGNVQ
jgi:integrase